LFSADTVIKVKGLLEPYEWPDASGKQGGTAVDNYRP